jgi:general stress protein CsbA
MKETEEISETFFSSTLTRLFARVDFSKNVACVITGIEINAKRWLNKIGSKYPDG